MTEITDQLDELFDEKEISAAEQGSWWNPTEEGESVKGKITRREKRVNKWSNEEVIFAVRSDDGEVYTLPTHTVLQRLLLDNDVQAGDYVRVRYEGEDASSDRPNPTKLYALAKVSAEELEEMETGPEAAEKEEEVEEPEVEEPEVEEPEVEEIQKSEEKKSESNATEEEEEPSEKGEIDDEVTKFVDNLMDFNDELSIEELDNYLNDVRNFGVDAKEAAIDAGYTVDDDTVRGE